jgi:hypothetical protein
VIARTVYTYFAPPRSRGGGALAALRPLRPHRRAALGVAVQVDPFERHIVNPVFHLVGARVETTWVPGAFQLWVRGSQRAPPHLGDGDDARDVALQVAFERQTLKRVFHLIGVRLWV